MEDANDLSLNGVAQSIAPSAADVRTEMVQLRLSVDEALQTAYRAMGRVRQLKLMNEQPASTGAAPPQDVEVVMQERLQAFETYIIQRVREENAAAAVAAQRCSVSNSEPSSVSKAAVATRKVELQLEAQRSRSSAVEQRLSQLEVKLNALIGDVVMQAQKEHHHQSQLKAMVQHAVAAEMHVLQAPAPAPPASVDRAALSLVTATLGAMHQRVEEQQVEWSHSQEQFYELMSALVVQVNKLKKENGSLRGELTYLRGQQR